MSNILNNSQYEAISKMKNGCILNGGVGSGKSRTALYYYFKENGGSFENNKYTPMNKPKKLFIITTARKRDTKEWESELGIFMLAKKDNSVNFYNTDVTVDSWNNISKYKDIVDSFFIFDEQRVVGYGSWTKSFLKITKSNNWILLSATPGDKWEDYIPVFIANGFYKNKTEFNREHAVFSRFSKYPKVEKYINQQKLLSFRNSILVDIKTVRRAEREDINILVGYDRITYKDIMKNRWNPYKNEPIEQASSLCYVLRRNINEYPDRIAKLYEILEGVDRAIIFYNFDYELELLRNLYLGDDRPIAEWNGHKHENIPDTDKWIYLVQYTAGAEGWNCILTDTIIFYSQNYSYKVMEQSRGRIDRLNTPYDKLYYYHLKSTSSIDLAISSALNKKQKFNENKWLHM